MRCPHCQTEFTPEDARCPGCRADLTPIRKFMNAGRALHRLKQEVGDLQETLNAVENDLAYFRDHFFRKPTQRDATRPAEQQTPGAPTGPSKLTSPPEREAEPAQQPATAAEPSAAGGLDAAVDGLEPAGAEGLESVPGAAGAAEQFSAIDPAQAHRPSHTPEPGAAARPAAAEPARPHGTATHVERSQRPFPERPRATPHTDTGNAAELGFGQKWILIAGIVITLLGLGYFLKYSFDHNWIPEWARVAMAYAVSLFTLALGGWFASGKLRNFGLFLAGGGIGMLYASTFAGYAIYTLIPQPAAFGLMVAITAGSVYLALKFDTQWLAALGQIGGFLTPLLLSSGHDEQVVLMSYLMVLNLGLLVTAWYKQWSLINYLGAIFTWLLFIGWSAKYYDGSKLAVTLLFLNLFYLTFALAPYVYLLKHPAAALRDLAIVLPNSFLAMGFTYGYLYGAGMPRAAAAASVAYALVAAGMALSLRKQPAQAGAVAILWAQCGVFVTVTVPLLLSGGWITACWAALATLGILGARRLHQRLPAVAGVVLWVMTLIKLFFYDLLVSWQFHVESLAYQRGFGADWASRWVTFIAVIGGLYLTARVQPAAAEKKKGSDLTARVFAFTIFGFTLFVLLNLETAAGLARAGGQAQTASLSVLWTLFAVALMALGFRLRLKPLRILAIALLILTIGKVMLLDMANVDTPFRILSFVVLGVMMIGVSYLYHRFADRLMGIVAEEKPQVEADPAEFDHGPDWDQAKDEGRAGTGAHDADHPRDEPSADRK